MIGCSFAMGWNCSAHFISQWAGIDPPIFHFAMDHHAIIADKDSPLIAASDFIAALRASTKCKSHLIALNPVGMLCIDQPIAPKLPPHLPSNLRSPFHLQSCRGRRSSQRLRRHHHRSCTSRRGGSRGVPLLRIWSRRRCWPRSRHTPSPGPGSWRSKDVKGNVLGDKRICRWKSKEI